MTEKSIFERLVRTQNGVFTAAYGPFVLQTALQPIFRQTKDAVSIVAFEGLVRTSRDGQPFSPAQFFPMVDSADMAGIDSLLRGMHILNCAHLERRSASIFVNVHGGLCENEHDIRLEVERIRLAAHEAGLAAGRIVCELAKFETEAEAERLGFFVDCLRNSGIRIALNEYSASDEDVERMRALKPDFVKFDGRWVRDFMNNSTGFALLRVIVRQLVDARIQPVFEGMEETWQVDLAADLEVPLVQGYALARPELVPTTFNDRFPETSPTEAAKSDILTRPLPAMQAQPVPPPALRPQRHAHPFGRRGR